MKLPFNVDLKNKVAVVTGGSGILCGGVAGTRAAAGGGRRDPQLFRRRTEGGRSAAHAGGIRRAARDAHLQAGNADAAQSAKDGEPAFDDDLHQGHGAGRGIGLGIPIGGRAAEGAGRSAGERAVPALYLRD